MLSALPVAPHETFSHPVACVIAISSRNQSPIETLRNLYTEGTQVAVPAYVNGDYLRYYVLVHDEDRDDITKRSATPRDSRALSSNWRMPSGSVRVPLM